MRPNSNSWLLATFIVAALVSPVALDTLSAQAIPRENTRPPARPNAPPNNGRQDNGRQDNGRQVNGLQVGQNRDAYERGFREGERQGELDARRDRAFDFENDPAYRDGDRGYNQRYGSREVYRDNFRRGFAAGYRPAYERIRPRNSGRFGRPSIGGPGRQAPRGYQEPAAARGYADGYEQGVEDARDRDRYDPVGSRDYRDGEQGYYGAYGSRDAYRNNYRAGFRQGYDAGYRDVRR